ncbi:hypothetical protein IMZ48_22830 [Candidatus Bathyarchaeota archaeon]|nr:hypothetical protein [Candidatus Bathyarchaeota archaeon]
MRNGVNSEAIQTAQLKEDLYTDLTGLIVRGVKQGKEDIYDCLQTGRNGSKSIKWGRLVGRFESLLTRRPQPSTSSSRSRRISAGTGSRRRRSRISRSSTRAGTVPSSKCCPTFSSRTLRSPGRTRPSSSPGSRRRLRSRWSDCALVLGGTGVCSGVCVHLR